MPRPWIAILSLALSALLASLGISIANVALPDIAVHFGAGFVDTQWVVLSYLVTLSVFVVTAGRLGDLLGRRRVLLIGLATFVVGSLLSALAPTLLALIGARVVQGIGAATLMALTVAMVRDAVPERSVGTAMGTLGTTSAIGTALGPSVGGLLLAGPGWRAVFLFMTTISALACLVAMFGLPQAEPDDKTADMAETTPGKQIRFDIPGMMLLSSALVAYALAMTGGHGFGRREALLLLLSIALFAGFVMVERRVNAPMVRIDRIRHDPPLIGGLAVNAIVAAVMMSTLVVGPFYLSGALGLNMALVGLVMAIGPVISIFSGVPSGWLTDRLGAGTVSLMGLALMILGTAALATLPQMLGLAGYVAAIVLLTPGYQLFQASNNTAVTARAAKSERGVISALLGLSRNLGLVTGASLMGTIFAAGLGEPGSAAIEALNAGQRATFLVEAAALLTGLGLGLLSGAFVLSDTKPPTKSE